MNPFYANRAKFIMVLVCFTFLRREIQAAEFAEAEATGWYVRSDAVARFNVRASLHAANPVLPGGHYNDGFVEPDNGGVISGKTWNWGYKSASQVARSRLVLHRYDIVPAVGDPDL